MMMMMTVIIIKHTFVRIKLLLKLIVLNVKRTHF